MKKTLMTAAAVLLAALVVFTSGCTLYNSGSFKADGINYYLRDDKKAAFASECELTYGSDGVITVPDEINGAKVISLGGYFGTGVPSPFGVREIDGLPTKRSVCIIRARITRPTDTT